MSVVQTESQTSMAFSQDRLHQDLGSQLTTKLEHNIASGRIIIADGKVAVKFEHIDLDNEYAYLNYENEAVALSASEGNSQCVLEDEALRSMTKMQAELAERLNPSVEEHVEVVHLVGEKKNTEWSTVDNTCQDSQSMDYDIGNVIMVSRNEDGHPVLLEDMSDASIPGNTAESKQNKDILDEFSTHSKKITQSINDGVLSTNKEYSCSKCNKSFDVKRHFLKHLQVHFQCKDFECTECGERFYQRHCLELHRVTHLDVRKSKTVFTKQLLFECKLCRTRFSSIYRLKSHLNSLHRHTNQNSNVQQNVPKLQTKTAQTEIGHHICYHCQNTFKDKKTFSKHIKIHSLNFECVACPKSFHSKEELKNHNWTHFSFYSCGMCSSVFKSTRELTRHEGLCLSHLLSNRDLVDVDGDKLFVCDVCSGVFVKKQEFQKHLQGHVKQFRCRQCGSGYHSQAALENHEKFHEFNTHMYKCSDCPKSFYSLPLLQSHQKKHAAESKQCSICKEVFKSEEQRQKHKHLFLGNVKCDLCAIQCSGSHGLNMHKRLAHPDAQGTRLYPRIPKKSSEQIIVCVGDDVE